MRKYYTLVFTLVSVWATFLLTIPTKSYIGQSLYKFDQVSYANFRLFFYDINPCGLIISFPVTETSLNNYTNSLMFNLPLLINSINSEIYLSSKTVCS